MANTIFDFSESDHVSHYLFRGNGQYFSVKSADMDTETTFKFSKEQFLYFLQNLIDEHCFKVDENGHICVVDSIREAIKTDFIERRGERK